MIKKLQILRGTTAQNDAYTGSVGELTMDTEKVEVRIHDGTTQGGKTIGSSGGSMPDRYVESINGYTGNVFLGAREIGTYTSDEIDEKIAEAPASLPILFHTWSDCIMNNQSWLRADTFSWQSGDVYKAVYEHLSADLSNVDKLYCWYGDTRFYTKSETPSVGDTVYTSTGSDTGWTIEEIISNSVVLSNGYSGSRDSANDELLSYTDVIDGTTITYYVAQDGHKICLPDQESNLVALYESTGVAWYYILDTANKQFKLPRTKYGFTGLRDAVGNYVPESLPTHTHTRGSMNITGGFEGNELTAVGAANSNAWGAFKTYDSGRGGTSGNYSNSAGFTFDAASSWTGSTSEPDNSVYGSGKPVQQRATQMYLYFYAGNFEQSAVEQTAGLNAELFNGKADIATVDAIRSRVSTLEGYDYVVATQELTSANGNTWFRKYKSGWVEQGGHTTLNSGISATNKKITFPIVMKNNLYYANVSQDANAGPQLVMHGWQTTTGMTIGTSGVSATGFVEWIVSGMSA